jgi:hypothetical protein
MMGLRVHGYWLFVGLFLSGLMGCQQMDLFRFQSPDDAPDEDGLAGVLKDEQESGKRSLVRDYTTISGNTFVVVEGVGLVTQLDGTGGDSPTTNHRKELLDEMRRMQIENPNQWLRSPNTALVVVRAYLPALVDKGERIDVQVRLPEGTEATSLAGGWLLRCDLREKQVVQGRGVLSGRVLARAEGPILVTAADESDASGLMRGTIPAGAVCLRDEIPLSIHLQKKHRGVRMADLLTKRIGERFHDYDESGIRRPLARFVADSRIDLEVHPRYEENVPRYIQVVRHIAFTESKVERQLRIQRLRDELRNAPTSSEAALQLEAIGRDAIPVLKEGLAAPSMEARFHAATALAYLGQDDGVEVLAEAAAQERAFRVHAFAAMAALDGSEAYQPLIDLLQHLSTETRYGAFRTLTTLNPNDPSVRGEPMGEQFTMHVIPSRQDPLIHITTRQKTELVLFGDDQRFLAPLAVNAGKYIWVTAQTGEEHVVVSCYEPDKEGRRVEVAPYVAEVIRAVVDLGATYPDVVQMLIQAEHQHNLPGTIAIDALPQAGRIYYRPPDDQLAGATSARIGHQNMSPNLFPQLDENEEIPKEEGVSDDIDMESESVNEAEEAADAQSAPETAAASPETLPKSGAPLGLPNMKSVLSAISAYEE